MSPINLSPNTTPCNWRFYLATDERSEDPPAYFHNSNFVLIVEPLTDDELDDLSCLLLLCQFSTRLQCPMRRSPVDLIVRASTEVP